MKLIIYHKPNQNNVNQVMAAIFDGAIHIGLTPVWRDSTQFNSDNIEAAALVFLWGLPPETANREILYGYQQRNIPVLISDLGYLKRGTDSMTTGAYYQLGINQLNWLPPCCCEENRFQQLGLILPTEKQQTNSSSPVLLCGQVPNDAQHQMSKSQIKAWSFETLTHIRTYSQRPVIWRPHPLAPFKINGADGFSDPSQESLSNILGKAHMLISYNSNSGIEALLQGIPVFCDSKAHCTYSEVANLDLSMIVEPDFSIKKN